MPSPAMREELHALFIEWVAVNHPERLRDALATTLKDAPALGLYVEIRVAMLALRSQGLSESEQRRSLAEQFPRATETQISEVLRHGKPIGNRRAAAIYANRV